MAQGLSVKVPFVYDTVDGPFGLTKELSETAKQNFKNMVLTMPGEKIMDVNFGVGFQHMLFESISSETMELLRERIFDQTSKYLPYINITSLKTDILQEKNMVVLRIKYIIPTLGVSDKLELDIENQFG
tara:strand:- start:11884 stop:12270 length:387 start_codon:yes stop_codon:yes gene_type:complete